MTFMSNFMKILKFIRSCGGGVEEGHTRTWRDINLYYLFPYLWGK